MDLSCLNGVTKATADPEMYRLDILVYPLLLKVVVLLIEELVDSSFVVLMRIYREFQH